MIVEWGGHCRGGADSRGDRAPWRNISEARVYDAGTEYCERFKNKYERTRAVARKSAMKALGRGGGAG